METNWAELEKVLRQQHDLTGRLLDAARTQNTALRQNDIDALNRIIADIHKLNARMQQLEQQREQIQGRLEDAPGLTSGATLQSIAAKAPGNLSFRLLSLRREMRHRLEELQQLVKLNSLLTRNALRLNGALLNVFRKPGGATYGNNGRVQDTGHPASTFNKSV